MQAPAGSAPESSIKAQCRFGMRKLARSESQAAHTARTEPEIARRNKTHQLEERSVSGIVENQLLPSGQHEALSGTCRNPTTKSNTPNYQSGIPTVSARPRLCHAAPPYLTSALLLVADYISYTPSATRSLRASIFKLDSVAKKGFALAFAPDVLSTLRRTTSTTLLYCITISWWKSLGRTQLARRWPFAFHSFVVDVFAILVPATLAAVNQYVRVHG